MKISEIIEELEAIKKENGDISCIIENEDYLLGWIDIEVKECSVEESYGYGLSVKFLI